MYELILDELIELQDEKYRSFHSRLLPNTGVEMLGVRIPKLRAIAKRIINDEDWRNFIFEYTDNNIFECVLLSGLVIAGAKCDFEEKLLLVEKFIPRINNWAICDTFCSELKDSKKHLEEVYNFIEPYLKYKKEYGLRFGAVMLMDYFVNEEYIDTVLDWYGKIHSDYYYVKMAVAWGISVCFVKFRDKTLEFLQTTELDRDTFHKTVQKIRESYRVSDKDKELLKEMWNGIQK